MLATSLPRRQAGASTNTSARPSEARTLARHARAHGVAVAQKVRGSGCVALPGALRGGHGSSGAPGSLGRCSLGAGAQKKALRKKAGRWNLALVWPARWPVFLGPAFPFFPRGQCYVRAFFPPALEGSPLPRGHVTVLPAWRSRNRTREAGPLEMGPLARALGSARCGSAAAAARALWPPCRPECAAVAAAVRAEGGAAHMRADAGTAAATRPEDNALLVRPRGEDKPLNLRRHCTSCCAATERVARQSL